MHPPRPIDCTIAKEIYCNPSADVLFISADDGLKLWLALFRAKTEEDLAKIEALEVPVMQEAIEAYRHVSATDKFKELERMRSYARHNEASALSNARNDGYREADAKWQGVVAEKETAYIAAIAEKDARIAELQALLGQR